MTLLGKLIPTKPPQKTTAEAVCSNPACYLLLGQLEPAPVRVGIAAGSPQRVAGEAHCRCITPRLPKKCLLSGKDGMCCAHTALPSDSATSMVESGSFHPRGMGRRAGSCCLATSHPGDLQAQRRLSSCRVSIDLSRTKVKSATAQSGCHLLEINLRGMTWLVNKIRKVTVICKLESVQRKMAQEIGV